MICSSEKRFFTSNRLRVRDWTPNHRATQQRGDVDEGMLIFAERISGGAGVSASVPPANRISSIRQRLLDRARVRQARNLELDR